MLSSSTMRHSQNMPVRPVGQEHVKSSMPSMQRPPFVHLRNEGKSVYNSLSFMIFVTLNFMNLMNIKNGFIVLHYMLLA